ncbi:MAG: type II secretion system protein [Firmicutes bacterium]|nr:type II secretion system protein [Bacillota bacterium]
MKRGFTLVELLAVIILLGALSLIVVPVVGKIIRENKEQAYQTNIQMIEAGARAWAAENVFTLPTSIDDYIDLTICDLEKSGKIEIDVKNPKTGDILFKDSYVRVIKTESGYDYNYVESGSSLTCSN